MVHTRPKYIHDTLVADGTHHSSIYECTTRCSRRYTPDLNMYMAHLLQMVHTTPQYIHGTLAADGTHQTSIYTRHAGSRWYTPDLNIHTARWQQMEQTTDPRPHHSHYYYVNTASIPDLSLCDLW